MASYSQQFNNGFPLPHDYSQPNKIIPETDQLQSSIGSRDNKAAADHQINDRINTSLDFDSHPETRIKREISLSNSSRKTRTRQATTGQRSSFRSTKKFANKRHKLQEAYKEAMHNTRDTITVVSVLIATFTYSAGINPPGGLHQDGPLMGTSMASDKMAFKVFSVCNNVALFTSLSVVLVLVSIIPFRRKPLKKMMFFAHKAIWVAVSFMAAGYVAAWFVIIDRTKRKGFSSSSWIVGFLVSLCVGSLGTVFAGLLTLLVKHRIKKREWRRRRARQRWLHEISDDYDSSIISDIFSADDTGYHSY